MNDRDRDLILALTEGRLPADEAAGVEARLAADPELSAELAAQRRAMLAAAGAPPDRLTDLERTRLRADLRRQLGLTTAAGTTATPRRRWLVPVASFAGAAAVIVAAVVVVPTMTGGGADSEELTGAAATTTLAESVVTEAGEGDGADVMEDAETSTTTAAAAEAPMVPRVESYDLAQLRDRAAAGGAGAMSVDELAPIDVSQFESCFDELADELPGSADYSIQAVAEEDGKDVLLITYKDAAGVDGAAAVDPVSCELVATADR